MAVDGRAQVLVAVGTRPEAIKTVPVIRTLRESSRLRPLVVSTGQHRELLTEVFDLAGLRPDSVLGVGRDARYLAWALMHGDTSSAAAVALAAFHLAPTSPNEENLILEGVRHEQVFVTGNTAIDALLWASVGERPTGVPELDAVLADPDHRLVVVTAHRREAPATGALGHVAQGLAQVAAEQPGTVFVLPLHPNPAVRAQLRPVLGGLPNVLLTEPLPYPAFAALLRRAVLVVTDSGGIQEEAPALGAPVLVTRETAERTEGVDAGTLRLIGTESGTVAAAVCRLLTDEAARAGMTAAENPYGDGRAAERIVAALEHLTFRTPKPARFGSGYQRAAVLRAAGFDESAIHRAGRVPA